ncbi:metabolite traffic protein EboE [Aquirufa sp. 2-AUSEE-184A6]|uniref:Metabolite traffic protein EboE n=1 Tax=Aquirufa novilacunae TaxID=3139305 RepID=A0ABW8SX54_9BACT
MKTPYGHLSYCSNIHTGEIWTEHFAQLQAHVPAVKAQVSPDEKMGLGLRFANQASIDLQDSSLISELKNWLKEENLYVFTLNGFPYGGFHNTIVKDQVHAPDWTTTERRDYTIRLAHILAQLLEENEGGISTSPLSYRYWFKTEKEREDAKLKSTKHLLEVVEVLDQIAKKTGKVIHIDIEPEPDGLLSNHTEFVHWYEEVLLTSGDASLIRKHVQLCFDICHYGVSFDEPETSIAELKSKNIPVGKIQISSALHIDLRNQEEAKIDELKKYREPVYLHQVKALRKNGTYEEFKDLDEAFDAYQPETYDEWRVHFHVPLFLENYGLLGSTQKEIRETLAIQKENPFTNHLEIETYTWGVLPAAFQVPIADSISREIKTIQELLGS